MELQDIQLTEQDFNLLIEGLNELPHKGAAGRMMADLIGDMLGASDPSLKAKINKELNEQYAKEKLQKQLLAEEVTLLKSKIILLKRYLITNGALKTTNKILGNE